MERIDLEIRRIVGRRGLIATALLVLVVSVVAAAPRLLGSQLGKAVHELGRARPLWLWLAALGFVSALLCSSLAWRAAVSLCGGRLSRSNAAARYGLGSLVNGVTPIRFGEAVRLALFGRALPGPNRIWRMGGVFATITVARAFVFALVIVAGAAAGALPLWPVLLIGVLCLAAAGVALTSRGGTFNSRAASVLEAFRELGRSPLQGARIVGWIGAGTVCRFGAATAIAAALGVRAPVTAALIILPALDVAGLLPLSGNLGITSGTVAMALRAHGVGLTKALSTGLAFHAVETAAGITFGLASVLLLTRFRSPAARRRALSVAAAASVIALAFAVGATILDFV